MKILCIAVFLLFSTSPIFALKLDDIKKGFIPRQSEMASLISETVVEGHLDDLDRVIRNYPEQFSGLSLSQAFYEAGKMLYDGQRKMQSLRAFMKGFNLFTNDRYKELCGYYIAKVFYQTNRRESALFYINRLLQKQITDPALLSSALRLKRQIRWEYISAFEGLPDESICDIEFDGDDLWVGMWTGGIARFTRSANTLTLFKPHKNGLLSSHVRDILDYDNRIWVGTYDGLCYFDKKKEVWVHEKGLLGETTIKSIKLAGKKLYAATLGKGLFVYDKKKDRWTSVFKESLQITDFTAFGKNEIAVATLDKGLYISKGAQFKAVFTSASIKCVNTFNNTLWAGTHGKGIYLFNQSRQLVKHMTMKNGLTSDFIESLKPVSNIIIIGTLGGGANVFHSSTGVISSIGILDGLPSNDVVEVSIERNKIWFGTLSGGIGILTTENFEDL